MLKIKNFVFALLTLICISSVAREEQIYPEAKEWPKFEGFEWGMSKDEFYEACAAKNLKRYKRLNPETGTYYTAESVKGMLLGEDVQIRPIFEYIKEKSEFGGLRDYFISFSVSLENRRRFFEKIINILEKKYGPAVNKKGLSKYYGWVAPDMPHIECLEVEWAYDLEYYVENKKTPKHAVIRLLYHSKSSVKGAAEAQKKRAAEQRELEKKAKEDEKDF